MVRLREGDAVPCDMVLLSSSHEQGHCYVETANLDGETSLKTKHSAAGTKDFKDEAELAGFRGFIECENPNPKLDSFLGRLTKVEGPSKVD